MWIYIIKRTSSSSGCSVPVKMIFSLLLVFGLTSSVSGSLVVNGTQTSYRAEEHQDITLEWTFTPRTSTSPKSIDVHVEMFGNLTSSVLLHLQKGVEVPKLQDEQFAGRVRYDEDVLREGRVKLHVSRLRISDSGRYVCKVQTSDGANSGSCDLSVSAARDQLKPETPELISPSEPESHGPIGLYVGLGLGLGLTAVAVFCAGLYFIFSHSSSFRVSQRKQAIRTI